VSDHAPRITVINIPREKIREVIGTGGKVIREITETTGASLRRPAPRSISTTTAR
jgi:polyribonucleotide nucleotidyltransferase